MPRIELELSQEDYDLVIEKLIPSGYLEIEIYGYERHISLKEAELYIPPQSKEIKP